jgi:hypothetical protein
LGLEKKIDQDSAQVLSLQGTFDFLDEPFGGYLKLLSTPPKLPIIDAQNQILIYIRPSRHPIIEIEYFSHGILSANP